MCHDKFHTQMSELRELTKLPYFEWKDDDVALADVGPVADVHSHLALSFVRRHTVDLEKSTPTSETYLPANKPLDLEVYMNQNIDKKDMKSLRRDMSVRCLTTKGMRQTHTAPNLVRMMEKLRISHSIILAIDAPALSWNTEDYLAIGQKYPQLPVGCSIHPARPNAIAALRRAAEAGPVCMKMHPAVQHMRPDHPKAMALYEACGELGIPVMWHGGPVGIVSKSADERCQMKHYWRAVHALPKTTFILGHAGALQYDMAIELVRAYENCYMEISCQGLVGVKEILNRTPRHKVMHGSDWPFYHQAVSIAKVLLATEKDEELRRNVLFDNADRIYNFTGIKNGKTQSQPAA